MSKIKTRLAAGLGAAAIVTVGLTGSASAVDQPDYSNVGYQEVTTYHVKEKTLYGGDIRDETLESRNVYDGTLVRNDINPAWAALFDNRALAVESDGPYPGRPDEQNNLQNLGENDSQGAQSTELVPFDGKVHTVWVMCPAGKTGLGGGFTLGADQGAAIAKAVQVVASEPAQIRRQGDGYASVYQPIAGDAAGSFTPNGWKVDVINDGVVQAMVRPHVVCVKVG